MVMIRFWERVLIKDWDDCWIWVAAKSSAGYGQFRMSGLLIYAHRYSWEISNGIIPPKMCVLHRCDNPACVNPNHLFLGTQTDNMADKVAKGRQRAGTAGNGEKNHKAKLTLADVMEIRKSSLSGKTLAQKYGIHPGTVTKIKLRQTWRHV